MLDIQQLNTEHQAVLLTMSILDQIMSKREGGQAKTHLEAEAVIKELQKTGFDRWARIIRAIVLNNRVD